MSNRTSEWDKGTKEMREISQKIAEINKPKKRWYEYLGVKPAQPKPFMFDIEGRPAFTDRELAERRAFLDGYENGRRDGDSHEAYKLWRKITNK